MLNKFWPALLAISATSMLLIACGSGKDETPTAAVPTTVKATSVVPTTAPSSAAVATLAATQPTGSTGTILDKALFVSPIENDNPRYGGTFRWPTNQGAGNLDPKLNNSTTISRFWRYTYEKLVAWYPNPNDPLSHLQPQLAEKWSASADLKTYTFSLRKGVKWHNIAPVNGREVVADDAVFSFNRYREKDAAAYPNWIQVDSVEATDKYTVVIKLKDSNAFAPNELFGALEAVVPPELVKASSSGFIGTDMIGTGPYILKSYIFRQGADYIRNPEYWQKDTKGNPLPYADAIKAVYIGDPATVQAAFRTGQLDYADSITPEQIIQLGKQTPDIRVYSNGVLGANGVAFTSKNKPWDDVRVRRAFNMALDKTKFMNAQGTPGIEWNIVGPIPWNLIEDRKATLADLGQYYKYNPQEAKRLLIEAGFPDGKIKVASPLVFINPSGLQAAQVMQEFWKNEGLEVPIQGMSLAEFALPYYARKFTDLAYTFQNTGESSLNWYAQNKFNPEGSENTSWINDPEINKRIKALKTTTDPVKLKEYARFFWDFETSNSYTIWVPQLPGYSITTSKVRNHTVRSNHQFIGMTILPWLTDAPRTAP
ncbi:MAG: ABC transporter substrate-binding protein [Dehalococcoidia bacterium]|nr:ABC transporter substrate-binding protein [Dehalococcoidia bacterium]